MLSDESLMGIRRADPAELKPLKFQLPLNYVLALHKLRIVGSKSVSEIVADALETYFAEQKAARQEAQALALTH